MKALLLLTLPLWGCYAAHLVPCPEEVRILAGYVGVGAELRGTLKHPSDCPLYAGADPSE